MGSPVGFADSLSSGCPVVGKKKRRRREARLLGSHQKCWLWGRHAVVETLRAARWQPVEVVVDHELVDESLLSEIVSLCESQGIDLLEATGSDLARLCGSTEHQGLMAKMPPYPYADARRLLQRVHARSVLLVLAGIQDPFNFGSILRSADLFGIDAVIVPTTGQAVVSSHVARSSVGAVNYLDIVEVDDLAAYCREIKVQGLQLLGASERGEISPAQRNLATGLALIIGNEGTGVPEELLQLCDALICIPLQGHVGSLNAAVAAGILCYEVRRQRDS